MGELRDKTMDNRPTPPEELLLIRAGHHLWRLRKGKEWPEQALWSALQTIWDAKEALRVELRQQYREAIEKRKLNLTGRRFGQ